jgi:hypothetical protein
MIFNRKLREEISALKAELKELDDKTHCLNRLVNGLKKAVKVPEQPFIIGERVKVTGFPTFDNAMLYRIFHSHRDTLEVVVCRIEFDYEVFDWKIFSYMYDQPFTVYSECLSKKYK